MYTCRQLPTNEVLGSPPMGDRSPAGMQGKEKKRKLGHDATPPTLIKGQGLTWVGCCRQWYQWQGWCPSGPAAALPCCPGPGSAAAAWRACRCVDGGEREAGAASKRCARGVAPGPSETLLPQHCLLPCRPSPHPHVHKALRGRHLRVQGKRRCRRAQRRSSGSPCVIVRGHHVSLLGVGKLCLADPR